MPRPQIEAEPYFEFSIPLLYVRSSQLRLRIGQARVELQADAPSWERQHGIERPLVVGVWKGDFEGPAPNLAQVRTEPPDEVDLAAVADRIVTRVQLEPCPHPSCRRVLRHQQQAHAVSSVLVPFDGRV